MPTKLLVPAEAGKVHGASWRGALTMCAGGGGTWTRRQLASRRVERSYLGNLWLLTWLRFRRVRLWSLVHFMMRRILPVT
jgi:hypothetical protein